VLGVVCGVQLDVDKSIEPIVQVFILIIFFRGPAYFGLDRDPILKRSCSFLSCEDQVRIIRYAKHD
jgi:hypothetical protein